MHRLAYEVSGGLVVALPGPGEDHNSETSADLQRVLAGRPDVAYAERAVVTRLIEDLTASYTGGWFSSISVHGGGSPEAMRREIHRTYPIADKQRLVARLLDRGVLAGDARSDADQPGQCCDAGCTVPEAPDVPKTRRS
jgi:4-hydroxybutyryl-CoA dehydratase/vinylacetyl-CoA-Delta-isomerase